MIEIFLLVINQSKHNKKKKYSARKTYLTVLILLQTDFNTVYLNIYFIHKICYNAIE